MQTGQVTKTAADVAARRDPSVSSTPPAPTSSQPVSRIDRWLANKLLAAFPHAPLQLQLWNGETLAHCSDPEVTVAFHRRDTFRKVVRNPAFQFGEGYTDGTLTIHGFDLVNFLRIMDGEITQVKADDTSRWSRFWPFKRKRRRNTLSGSQQNIHHHYDIGNEFYKLWLDEQLLYTCAYFEDPGMPLEQAQIAKMDHVCQKVWLKPGDTVVEAGCGWGAFALHMARHYDVNVKAYNISKEQIAYARGRAESEGLADRVEFVQKDWRDIQGEFDAFVSIGMLEHVGTENYEELGRVVRRSLNKNGRGLIHSIGQNQPRPFDAWIEHRVFPGAYPPTLAEMMDIFENNALSVLDVENIRLHYAETLAHWLDRFEQTRDTTEEMFDERFVRMWRLYLAGSFAAFEADRLQLYQVLFSPEKRNRIPRNRRYIYDGTADPTRFDRHVEVGPTNR